MPSSSGLTLISNGIGAFRNGLTISSLQQTQNYIEVSNVSNHESKLTCLVAVVITTLELAGQRISPSCWEDYHVNEMTELKFEYCFNL